MAAVSTSPEREAGVAHDENTGLREIVATG